MFVKFPIFSWNTSAHLGYEVITPKCLNTSMYFWPLSVSGNVKGVKTSAKSHKGCSCWCKNNHEERTHFYQNGLFLDRIYKITKGIEEIADIEWDVGIKEHLYWNIFCKEQRMRQTGVWIILSWWLVIKTSYLV